MKPFLPIILVVIAVGIFYAYIDPQYMEVRNLLSQRSEYTHALANIEEVKILRDELETQISDLSAESVSRLEKSIPREFDVVKLTADLDALAGRRGMSVRNVRVVEESTDSGATINAKSKDLYKTTTMSFSVVGTYANFLAYLKDIEQSLQIIDVRAVNMRISSTTQTPVIMSFDLTVHTYWIK